MRPIHIVPKHSKEPTHQATILCIDDQQPTLEVRTALLESAGYRVFGATTANAAMEMFVAQEIDLVLSDHMLRDVSGAELSIFMKQVRPGVAVVLLSGTQLPITLMKHVDARLERGGATADLLSCLQDVLAKQAKSARRAAAAESRGA